MAEAIESASGAEALMSIKNGSRSKAQAKSPARRANPPRIRKRNRLFFNDDEDTSYAPVRVSPRKTPRLSSPQKAAAAAASAVAATPATPDKKTSQNVYFRLRNLLKLPKAHKWVCYEFFYSNLDLPLFKGDNDFCLCLKDAFPRLKVKTLTRVQWCKTRRLMGKPRRCSTAFFNEERAALHNKRSKIRLLQQRKVADVSHFKELPSEVPLPLVIGTKVTARIRKPQDGLFTGSIDAVDTSNATYRVTFDKQGLGTHSIPDYEVLSNEPQETMPLTAFAQTNRPRNLFFQHPRFNLHARSTSPQLENDPVLSSSTINTHPLLIEGRTLGGFPMKFLVLVVCLTKILNSKREKILHLKDMNTQAEKLKSYQDPISLDFQKRYAGIVLELEKLNKDLNEYLVEVQQFCQELQIAPEQDSPPAVQNNIQEKCTQDASAIVERVNKCLGRRAINNKRIVELITGLTSVMLQVQALGDNEFSSFELKALNESLNEIKRKMDPKNISVFQNNIEIHINHIQSGLSQVGNLHAFASQSLSS